MQGCTGPCRAAWSLMQASLQPYMQPSIHPCVALCGPAWLCTAMHGPVQPCAALCSPNGLLCKFHKIFTQTHSIHKLIINTDRSQNCSVLIHFHLVSAYFCSFFFPMHVYAVQTKSIKISQKTCHPLPNAISLSSTHSWVPFWHIISVQHSKQTT